MAVIRPASSKSTSNQLSTLQQFSLSPSLIPDTTDRKKYLMKKSRRTLAEGITVAFLPATLLGFFTLTYRKATGKFKQSVFLKIFHCVWYIAWGLSFLGIYFCLLITYFCVGLQDPQSCLIWCANLLQQWILVILTYRNFSRRWTLLCSAINSMLTCNKNLLRCIKLRHLPSGESFKAIVILRVTATIADIWGTSSHESIEIDLYPEVKTLHLASRVVLLASFLQWYFIQKHLLRTFLALNNFVKRGRLRAEDYEQLSRICTCTWHLKQSSDRYFDLLATATVVSLMRTIALLTNVLDQLFFTRLKTNFFFTLLRMLFPEIIPALAPVLELLAMGLLGEHLKKTVADFQWSVLLSEYDGEEHDVNRQRAIDMILRQALWEDMRWVTLTGQTVCNRTTFQATMLANTWMFTFLIYEAGRDSMVAKFYGHWFRKQSGR